MAHPKEGPYEWREMVLRHHAPGMNEGTRVLLMVISDRMDSRRYVSVPRSQLAAMLDVAPARITERILVAKELGLLDVVQSGRPGRTATYQGLFPRGTHVRTKSRRQNALGNDDPLGTGERTSNTAPRGTHVPDASSKRKPPQTPVLSAPVVEKKAQQENEPPPCPDCGQPLKHPWELVDGLCRVCKKWGGA